MAAKKIFLVFCLIFLTKVESASILERSYEYVMSWGKNLAPNFMAIVDCMGEDDVWLCAKQKAGKMLDSWDEDVQKQRRKWQEDADTETKQTGRSVEEPASKIGSDVEASLLTISDVLQHSIARSFSPKKHGGGGIDTITISTDNKKKDKKKKKKPVHVVQVPMMMMEKKEKGVQTWVIGDEGDDLREHEDLAQNGGDKEVVPRGLAGGDLKGNDSENSRGQTGGDNFRGQNEGDNFRGQIEGDKMVVPRGFLEDAWAMGEKAIDSFAEQAMEMDNAENGLNDKSSVDEQRGKKKKKKKAILKLLLLGAVLKAKIGTLLQILSFKLQVKFLLIALAGLLINIARFWIDVKKQGHQQPQKVIYYEHAQHQHHYDHEEEPGWGGPWSRSIDPEEAQDGETVNSPYHAQERIQQAFIRPVPTRI